jgi:TonB-dependent SusC/RagA subfamily outer membrane receptor
METYLIYIGKAALAAGAFYLVYLALFQNQKQFTFNRIYLPVSLALSFAIPLITFTTVNYVEPVPVELNPLPVFTESFEPVIRQQSQPQFIWDWYHYMFAIYAAGTALFLFRLMLGHGKAWNIIRKSRVQELFNSLVNISKKDIHPFSFFGKIVLSENTLSHPNLKIIVEHEKIHVQEKHTLDILFTETLFLLQWFNPFAWLLKDAVKNNLEYKTDHEIAKTTDARTYQMAMVALADKQGVAPFLTAMNGSQLKSRIIMMKRKTENKYAWLKQLIVLPILAILVMGLAEREVRTEFIKSDKTVEISMTSPGKYTIADIEVSGIRYLDETVLIQLSGLKVGETIELPGEAITNAVKKLWQPELFSDVRITASKIVGDDIWLDIYLQEQYKDSQNTIKGKVTNEKGEPVVGANIIEYNKESFKMINGTITNVNGQFILKLIQNPEDATIQFSHHGYEMQKVHFKGKEEINIQLEPEKPEDEKQKLQKKKDSNEVNSQNTIPDNSLQSSASTSNSATNEPLYVVDGEQRLSIKDIPPDEFESISVLNKETSTALYGQRGKNGVILITTKKNAKNNKIITERQLRQFIAEHIKYPVEAQEKGLHGQVSTYIIPGKTTRIVSGEKYTAEDIFNLAGVVVTADANDGASASAPEVDLPILVKEVERVLQMLPEVDIPVIDKKLIRINVEFKLQSEE